VERSFGWFGATRRLCRDFEHTVSSSEAMVYLASLRRTFRVAATETANQKTLSEVLRLFAMLVPATPDRWILPPCYGKPKAGNVNPIFCGLTVGFRTIGPDTPSCHSCNGVFILAHHEAVV
jgi:hypothetical protein